jgi:hypothetical protein
MAILEFTKEQILDLVRQIRAEETREMRASFARNASAARTNQTESAEEDLRRRCAARGLSRDALNSDERELVIDDLDQDGRSCAS